ncbi:hypothetical protein [Carboxylicivirga sp. RSCT41]|uniref:hypothetical protein n=1 Tax=Carboxylicivirga agarovorans TaxID=3417570 RepID=UPI003D3255AE
MPKPQEALHNLDLVDKLNKYVPHILKKEKRILVHRSLSFIQRLSLPKGYPFRNGQQTNTKGCIVWTDYSISSWPLLLSLLKSDKRSFDQVLYQYFIKNDKLIPDWNIIKQQLVEHHTVIKSISIDELDRWYDEISATLIRPQAYHELYQWFGSDVRDIGYDAFDYFMESRNTVDAWQQAINKHLGSISNLPKEQNDYLMNKYLNKIINE